MRKKNGLIFEVEINHDCWVCDVTERNRDAYTRCTPSLISGNGITNIVDLTSPTPKQDLDFIRSHPLVLQADLLMRKPDGLIAKVVSRYDAMTLKFLNQTNVTLLESPLTRDGADGELLFAPSFKDMKELLSLWRDQEGFHDIKLKSKRYVKPQENLRLDVFKTSGFCDLLSAKEMLTARQLDIFQLACDHGYYDIPKKTSIEELALQAGVSPPTLAEHLRKAESKLLPIMLKVLRKI